MSTSSGEIWVKGIQEAVAAEIADSPEDDEQDDDDSYYCDQCKSSFKIHCEVHGPPVFALDSPCPVGTPQRALLTLPAGLVVGRSRIREGSLGVFNQGPLVPVGMHFGPYNGELTTEEEAMKSIYSWVVSKRRNCYAFMDATRDTHSNWMRFVMCSRSNREQNLVAFQQGGRVLFRCCAPIRPGQELLVWYSEEYAKGLGLTWDQMWNNKLSSATSTNTDPDASQALACPYCRFSLPVKPYLQRHVRRSHAAHYQNFLETHSVESEEVSPSMADLDTCLLGSDVPPSEHTEPISDTEALCQSHQSNGTRCWNGTGSDTASASTAVSDQRHRCSICGQAFARAYHLKRHVDAVHAPDKLYWYKRSQRSLRKPANPRRHQLTPQVGVEGEDDEVEERARDDGKDCGAPLEVYPCGQCFIAFMSLPSLQEHMALQHAQGQRLKGQRAKGQRSNAQDEELDTGASTEVLMDVGDPSDPPYEPPTGKGSDRKGALKASSVQKRGRGRPPRSRTTGPARTPAQQPKQRKLPQANGRGEVETQTQICPHCGEGTTGASHRCCDAQSLLPTDPGAETPTQLGGTQLTCGECQRMFADAASLQMHECMQVGEGPYSCSQCSLSFNLPSNLRRHHRTVHALIKPYCCRPCGKFYTQASGLRRHQEGRQHKRRGLSSTRASANANANVSAAATPMTLSTAATAIYSCTYCQFSFTAQRFLLKHVKRHHPAEFMQETENEDGFGGVADANATQDAEELAELSQKCSQCEKTFFSIKGFKLHRCFRRGKPVYPCTVCSKRFSNLYSLRQHERTHTGERPYVCPHCSKSFAVCGQLNVHLRTHTGERPYLCAQCGKGFRQSGDLKRHEQKHLGVRPHRCPQCSKRFSRPQSLRAHLQIHSGMRFFHCTQCSKAFTRRYHLTRHLQKMHSA